VDVDVRQSPDKGCLLRRMHPNPISFQRASRGQNRAGFRQTAEWAGDWASLPRHTGRLESPTEENFPSVQNMLPSAPFPAAHQQPRNTHKCRALIWICGEREKRAGLCGFNKRPFAHDKCNPVVNPSHLLFLSSEVP